MKKLAIVLSLVAIALGGLAAYPFAFASGSTPCPGKIVCPLTGDEVCKDQCPLIDTQRSDCPGKIECPLTGELVCRDRCPIARSTKAETAKPNCCQAAAD